MSDKKYWQNFEELNQNEAEQKALKNEFKEELPFEDWPMKIFLMQKRREEIF